MRVGLPHLNCEENGEQIRAGYFDILELTLYACTSVLQDKPQDYQIKRREIILVGNSVPINTMNVLFKI